MKKFKRLFIGIPIPAQLQTSLYQPLVHLQQDMNNGIRWIPKENYHITLQFIGNTSPDSIEIIIALLNEGLANTNKFHLNFTQYVFFPHRNPYMIWAKAEERSAFDSLQKNIQLLLKMKAQVSKPAIPHITIARFKNSKMAKKIDLPDLKEPLTLQVDSIVLWESVLRPAGAIYQKISTFNFSI